MSSIPSRASKRPSGTHPAVIGYRKKLQSIDDHETPSVEKLNEELQKYLDEITTIVTPPQENG